MKKVSKKAFALLLSSTMVVALAGCGGSDSAPAADNAPAADTGAADTQEPAAESNAEDSGSSEAAAPSADLSGDLDISKYSLQNIRN